MLQKLTAKVWEFIRKKSMIRLFFSKVTNRQVQCTNCKSTINRCHQKLFSEFVLKISCLNKDILRKNSTTYCALVLSLWSCSRQPRINTKTGLTRDLFEEPLKILMHLQENFDGSFFVVNLQVQNYHCNFIKNRIHHRVFLNGFFKVALFKTLENFLRNI